MSMSMSMSKSKFTSMIESRCETISKRKNEDRGMRDISFMSRRGRDA